MKRIIPIFLILINVLSANAQIGYRYKDKFVELIPDSSSTKFILQRDGSVKGKLDKSISKEHITARITPFSFIVDTLGVSIDSSDYISDIYHTKTGNSIIVLPKIMLALNEGKSISDIKGILPKDVCYESVSNSVYRFNCKVQSSKDVFRIVSEIEKLDAVKWCEPDKYSNISTCNTYYPDQYYLHNTGQNSGTAGIDINVEPAWAIVPVCSNVKIAVIDTGLDNNHEDMNGCVLDGYTVGYPSSKGAPENPNSIDPKGHGMVCAGIIGANNNSIGIRGIADSIKILPVNIFPHEAYRYWTPYGMVTYSGACSEDSIAHAIDWAVEHGADILNCSWIMNAVSSTIEASIDSATVYGRNGLGTIVVASSGNSYPTSDTPFFPANLPNVIAVGSINRQGVVSSFSQRGYGLDVVAPGEEIVSTDRMGNLGYTSDNYTYSQPLDGTSFSCPQVSATVALMLSKNPNLSHSDVISIIRSTCEHLPAYTYNSSGWESNTGYGLINSYKAVLEAIAHNLEIIGATQLCGSEIYYVNNLPTGFSVQWSFENTSSGANNLLQSDYPITNQCIINIENHENVDETLIAKIYYGSDLVTTLSKQVTTNWQFSGTYVIRNENNVQLGNESNLNFGDVVWIAPLHKIIINSSLFGTPGVNITHTNSPYLFYRLDDSEERMMISFTKGSCITTVTGTSSSACNNFYFTVRSFHQLLNSNDLNIILYDRVLKLSLNRLDKEVTDSQSYSVAISNSISGQTVYKGVLNSEGLEVDTKSWVPGIYVVTSGIDNSTYKILIK